MIAPKDRNGLKPIATVREAWTEQSPGLAGGSKLSPEHENDIIKMVSAFVHDHPGASLLVAITLGGLAGWFVKRRK